VPDANKLEVLSDLSYQVQGCCGLCVNGRFAPGIDWGSCKVFTYDHGKHGRRQLSIHRAGVCASDFKINEKKHADLTRSGFDRFLDPLDVAENLNELESE
jgi:hypothetical protein